MEKQYEVFNGIKVQVVGICPVCGGVVGDCGPAWGCENHFTDKKCTFKIWKKQKGVAITDKSVEKVLKGEKVGPYNLTTKNGKYLGKGNLFLSKDPKWLEKGYLDNDFLKKEEKK